MVLQKLAKSPSYWSLISKSNFSTPDDLKQQTLIGSFAAARLLNANTTLNVPLFINGHMSC